MTAAEPTPSDTVAPAPPTGAEGRGHLKIFLGAAPGVGKTFAMLESAHERLHAGADVIVGVVDTHGRPEPEPLLDGLGRLPVRAGNGGQGGGGDADGELDVDAVIARRPQIVLIDDLARANPSGARHPARHHDVDEILAAGIDVYTTLNVQHLESLSDVVEQIAGVKPGETLPDSVLHQADEIEVVDLSPEDLLTRLAEGKVHLPEPSPGRELFSRGRLTAFRELALREAALRVDAQMLDCMRSDAVHGPWAIHDRVLVTVVPGTAASRLVRAAKRIADRRGAPWVAVCVETHRHHSLDAQAKERIGEALRLAAQLGGETRILHSDDVAGEILDYAMAHNISLILVGRQKETRTRPLLGRAVSDEILARAGDIDVLVVGRGEDDAAPRRWNLRPERRRIDWPGVAAALAGVSAVTGACWLAESWLPTPNITVAYLLVVLLVAIRLGLRPAILTSVVSFLAFNFFFTAPRLTFAVDNVQNTFTLLFFLAAAFIVSNLAGRVRRQMQAMKLAARRTATLYEFSRRIAGAVTQDDVLWAVVHHVAAAIRGRSLLLLPRGEALEIRAGYPPEDRLDEDDWAAARLSWVQGVPSGRGAATLPGASWSFLPLATMRGPIGVLGVQADADGEPPSPEQSRLLEALADQTALAIERTGLFADVEAAKIAAETERLRTGLLSSLSHELRSPIDGILDAADRLAAPDEAPSVQRRALALAIHDDAERLNRFVHNLHDMTRLGAGALRPRVAPTRLQDVVASALDRTQRMLKDRSVQVDIDPALPVLHIDRMLIEQVFFNLIDNACKYSPADSHLRIWARRRGDKVLIEVSDEGPGIPEADREKVFDILYRVEGAAGSSVTGLGLAICRGIIEAHDGQIRVDCGLNGVGASICFQLPIAEHADGHAPPA